MKWLAIFKDPTNFFGFVAAIGIAIVGLKAANTQLYVPEWVTLTGTIMAGVGSGLWAYFTKTDKGE